MTKVKELLDSREKWTQGMLARDVHGRGVTPREDLAVCYCLWGAVYKCYENDEQLSEALLRIRVEFIGMGVNQSIDDWNDAPERTFEEVRALINELDI